MEDKKTSLENIKSELRGKLSEEERMLEMGNIVSGLLSVVTARLIKDTGYSVTSTVLKREIRELAKTNAHRIKEIFGLQENTPENASKVLKIAALLLGLQLDTSGSETIVRKCPLALMSEKFHEPFFCHICTEYTQAIVREMLGPHYAFENTASIVKGDEYCAFQTKEKT